jgi:predicted RNA-binding protein associated with RNAse of E/G family
MTMPIGERFDISRDLNLFFTRLPDRETVYPQRKVHQLEECLMTAFHEPKLVKPIEAAGEVIVKGQFYGIAYYIWDEWYTVNRVYDRDLGFKGYYCDIITPIQKSCTRLALTDLFLDLFVFPDGRWSVEDEDEFEQGVRDGLMDETIERHAREAVEDLVAMVKAGEFPPRCVREHPRDPVAVLRALRIG